MPTASIKFNSEFLITAFRRYRRQHRGRYIGVAIKLLAIALLTPLAMLAFWRRHVPLGVFFSALCVLLFVAHHLDYWLIRRSFRKSPYRDEDVTIELSDVGVHVRSPKQDARLQWSAFTRVAHFKDGFLLFQGPKVFNWIPLASLDNPTQTSELASLLRSRIPEHRVIEHWDAP